MATMRSHFNLRQFQTVLQKLAHETAIDAITNLSHGDVRIVIRGSRFDTVDTNKVTIRFYAKHISYFEEPTKKYTDWWGFDVEKKLYITSNHSTKITFSAPEDQVETHRKKILQFIEKLMSDAKIKPEPRFSLAAHNRT